VGIVVGRRAALSIGLEPGKNGVSRLSKSTPAHVPIQTTRVLTRGSQSDRQICAIPKIDIQPPVPVVVKPGNPASHDFRQEVAPGNRATEKREINANFD